MDNFNETDTDKKEKDKTETLPVPPLNDLRMELAREEARYEFRRSLLNIGGVLAVAAAIAALMMTRLLMLLQVNGNSMEPTLMAEEIVMLRQTKEIRTGDIVGFYYGGKILLKRVIGIEGDQIEIDRDGDVYVNGELIEESYVSENNLGKCDQDFPCKIPKGSYFVLGDNRPVSIDSRIKVIGCVDSDQIVGKVILKVWPLNQIGEMPH